MATPSRAFRSRTVKPSLSVRTMLSLPQRLMMRMEVSMVVPIMSAISCRDSTIGMNVPSARFWPMSSASFSRKRASLASTRPPESSVNRLVSSTRRCVRPTRRPRTSVGYVSSSPKNACRGISRHVVGSSAIALAGYARDSYTATAPTGSPGPNSSRMTSVPRAVIFDTFTRPVTTMYIDSDASPSAKIVSPLSYSRRCATAARRCRSSGVRRRKMVVRRRISSRLGAIAGRMTPIIPIAARGRYSRGIGGRDVMNRDFDTATVGEIVTSDFRAAAVFERFSIDFCCGGNRSLADACVTAQADRVAVLDALRVATSDAAAPGDADAARWSVDRLIDHIVDTHHAYVRASLPRIAQHLEKLVSAHGERHPELTGVAAAFAEVAAELAQHMM